MRITELFKERDMNKVMRVFIQYLEEGSFFHLHTWERLIYNVVIKPFGSDKIQLSHMLTPYERPTLQQCANKTLVREDVNYFFATKQLCLQTYNKQALAADVRDLASTRFNVQAFPLRIRLGPDGEVLYGVPEHLVYRGYIDMRTIYEYYLSCDSDNILGDTWQWDPDSFQ